MYDFDGNATQETRDFVGYNNGTPMGSPVSKGLLSELKEFQEKCPEYNRSVPYYDLPVTFSPFYFKHI